MRQYKSLTPCTYVLIAVNVIVFFVLVFQGMPEDGGFMVEHGAMYVPLVIGRGEYYRLFTSMFLHFGFEHLMNNMITLWFMGWLLEREIGTVKFFLVYMLSGLSGNLLSAWWDITMAEYSVSAGASGAIFGVIGALFYVVLRNRGQMGSISGRRFLIAILLTLYMGYTSGGVDNMAHIGGLIPGFFLGILLYRKGDGKGRASSEV